MGVDAAKRNRSIWGKQATRDTRLSIEMALVCGIGYLGNVIWESFGKEREIRDRGLTRAENIVF